MEPEVIATARLERGKLTIRHRKDFAARLKRMRDGEMIVRVQRRRATRSLEQNRWYFGVIVELLSEHTGYTPDEIHEVLKAKFLPKRLAVTDGNGEIKDELVIGGTTTRLNKIEFGDYCESIRRWAAQDLGVVIPDPE